MNLLKFRILILATILTLFCISDIVARDATDTSQLDVEVPVYNPPPSDEIEDYYGPKAIQRSPFEEKMSMLVLGFALLVLIMEFILIMFGKLVQEQGIRIFAVTIIITSGLFLVTAGYSSEQIAPVTGLLGTIAGYLLGNINPKKDTK